ncbi:MAG: hypothetical protein ACYDDI_01625 [Candidatus Acidiferrales bacterium]
MRDGEGSRYLVATSMMEPASLGFKGTVMVIASSACEGRISQFFESNLKEDSFQAHVENGLRSTFAFRADSHVVKLDGRISQAAGAVNVAGLRLGAHIGHANVRSIVWGGHSMFL